MTRSPGDGKMDTAGGGCMMNQAIHTLDLMQHLVPGKILSIRGVIGHLLDYGLEVEDTASAKIVFQTASKVFSPPPWRIMKSERPHQGAM